ncbi:MAG: hypothetical protein IJY46_03840 [Lentisphaeria bacterium]|nr:hypothetical protein [Lentisphaeria bacterium]
MVLSEQQRIVLNVAASYCRALVLIICGVLTGRWMLQALGKIDFGLYGMICGMSAFVVFVNNLLTAAVSRFYAVCIGKSQVFSAKSLFRCQQYFSSALMLHVVTAIIFSSLGYFGGKYAITCWLNIPVNRLDDCLTMWNWVLLCSFIVMVSPPFTAMFTAKQLIAEVTVYQAGGAVGFTVFAFYTIGHDGHWLSWYAVAMCLSNSLPIIILILRALYIFDECRLLPRYLFSKLHIQSLVSYGWWNAFGILGAMLREQGMAILVNKFFGPRANSATTLSNQISTQTATFASSLITAFTPAVANAYGEGNYNKMRILAFTASKAGALLLLIFVLPLFWELPYIMQLWLNNVPEYTVGLCRCALIMWFIDKLTTGHMIAVMAKGQIAKYQALLGILLILTLPLAWIMLKLTDDIYCVGYAAIITIIGVSVGRLFFARKLVGMQIKKYLIGTFIPLLITTVVSGTFAYACTKIFAQGPCRLLMTVLVSEIILLVFAWLVVLENTERNFVRQKFSELKKTFVQWQK